MQIVTLRDRVLAVIGAVIVIGVVIVALLQQEQLKDDCRANGGFVTEIHDGVFTWICSPPGEVPIILHTQRRGRLLR